jgi:hypothetical protein
LQAAHLGHTGAVMEIRRWVHHIMGVIGIRDRTYEEAMQAEARLRRQQAGKLVGVLLSVPVVLPYVAAVLITCSQVVGVAAAGVGVLVVLGLLRPGIVTLWRRSR